MVERATWVYVLTYYLHVCFTGAFTSCTFCFTCVFFSLHACIQLALRASKDHAVGDEGLYSADRGVTIVIGGGGPRAIPALFETRASYISISLDVKLCLGVEAVLRTKPGTHQMPHAVWPISQMWAFDL